MEASALPASAAANNEALKGLLLWVLQLVARAAGVFLTAIVMGGLLYYVFTPFAAVFSFLNPINGYWNGVLVVLAAFTVCYIVKAAWDNRTFDLDQFTDDPVGSMIGLFTVVLNPGILLALAWVIVEYIQ